MEQLSVTKVGKASEHPDLDWLIAREPKFIKGHNVNVEVGHIGDSLKTLSEKDGFRIHRIAVAKEAVKWLTKKLKENQAIIQRESTFVGQSLA